MSLSSVFEIILRLTIIFLSDTIVLGGDILTVGERLRYLRKTKLGYKNCDDFGVRIGLYHHHRFVANFHLLKKHYKYQKLHGR